jgi:hypothetical protein
LADLASIVEQNGEHTALLNSLKQLGLYTDCYGNANWSEPANIFAGEEASLARHLVATAELLARGTEVTVREIELWIEHLGPVWGTAEMPLWRALAAVDQPYVGTYANRNRPSARGPWCGGVAAAKGVAGRCCPPPRLRPLPPAPHRHT